MLVTLTAILGLIAVNTGCRKEPLEEYSEFFGEATDTIVQVDTLVNWDTIVQVDTLINWDTIDHYINDTIINIIIQDSVTYIYISDTIVVNDTVYIIDDIWYPTHWTWDQQDLIWIHFVQGDPLRMRHPLRVVAEDRKEVNKEDFFSLLADPCNEAKAQNSYFYTIADTAIVTKAGVLGLGTLYINDFPVYQGEEFSLCGYHSGEETVSETLYEYNGTTLYELRSESGQVISSATQEFYSWFEYPEEPEDPEDPEEPEEPEINNQIITLSYSYEGENLVISGLIDNSLWADTLVELSIPMAIGVTCENPLIVNGTEFSVAVNGQPSFISQTPVQTGLTAEENGLQVTYSQFESLYAQSLTVSGQAKEVRQTVTHFGDFNVSFYGQTMTITPQVNLYATQLHEGSITPGGESVEKSYNLDFQATQETLQATASQEVRIAIQAIYFDGEEIVYANRSISFDGVFVQARIFDCILSKGNDGSSYYYRYREVGETGSWTVVFLSGYEEYDFLLSNAQQEPYKGLANYFVEGGGWLPGYVYSIDVHEEVAHFSFPNLVQVKDHVTLQTMYDAIGDIDAAVLDRATQVSGNLYEMGGMYFLFQ